MKSKPRKPQNMGTGIFVNQQFSQKKLVKGDTFFDADAGPVKWNGKKWIEDKKFGK